MTALIRRLPFLDALLGHASRWRTAGGRTDRPATREEEAGPGLEERRGDAMRRLFPKLHHWRATTFDRSTALQTYNFLAEATSVDELERRIHHLERLRSSRH